MRRYMLRMLIGTLAVVLSLIASQTVGQVRNGPLSGAVQNSERTVEGAEHRTADAAAGTVREERNIPPLPNPPQPNASAGNANVGADVKKQGGEARINAAPQPGASANAQADPKVFTNAAGVSRPDQWRYRWDNGRWWYWTPENRWMWYSDNGGWVYYDSAVPYSAGYGSYDVPSTGYYYPSNGTYYYPGYGYGYPGSWFGWGGYGGYGHYGGYGGYGGHGGHGGHGGRR